MVLKSLTIVTPYVGVWIETCGERPEAGGTTSLLMWECGLKLYHCISPGEGTDVTPYVGVWIETVGGFCLFIGWSVTPYVGVWIETS